MRRPSLPVTALVAAVAAVAAGLRRRGSARQAERELWHEASLPPTLARDLR